MRVHPISYFLTPKDDKHPLRLHQRRDVGAALELMPALFRQGYEYGEPILNSPPRKAPTQTPPVGELHRLDLSAVNAGDLLVQTTRPPMHDRQHGRRKKILRAFTRLEHDLFAAWGRFLQVCARSHVMLDEKLHAQIRPGYENRREMAFKEAMGAPYKDLNALDGTGWRRGPARRTAAFLIRVEELWPSGPGLIGAFGMDGTSTQVWAYRLGRDFAELLAEPGFVVAELAHGDVPDRLSNLRWAMEWDIEILVRYRD